MTIYKPVRALERGLAVLRAVNSIKGPTVEEVAASLRLSWSTTYRLLETLERLGYVQRGTDSKTFRPTVAVRSLSEGFDSSAWIGTAAGPVIRHLTEELVWPVAIMVFEIDHMVILETTHWASPMSLDRNMAGRRLPMLRSSAGLAYLASVSESERSLILERLRRGSGEDSELAQNTAAVASLLAKVRRDGCGSRERSLMPHTSSIAVPIRDGEQVFGCITLIWIATAFDVQEGIRRYHRRLLTGADRILASILEIRRPPAAARQP